MRRLSPARASARLGGHTVQNVRVCLAVLILAATVSACSSGNGGRRAETPPGVLASSAANSRVERCLDRLMEHARTQGLPNKRSLALQSKLTHEDTSLTTPERALMQQWLATLADAPTP
jgi:hypothetical protein